MRRFYAEVIGWFLAEESFDQFVAIHPTLLGFFKNIREAEDFEDFIESDYAKNDSGGKEYILHSIQSESF